MTDVRDDALKQEIIRKMMLTSLKARLLRQFQESQLLRPRDFTEREVLALEVLSEFGAMGESGLGRILCLVPSSAADLVKKLPDKDVVEKGSPTGTDGRQKPLNLTREGKKVLNDIHDERIKRAKFLLEGLQTTLLEKAQEIFSHMQKQAHDGFTENIIGHS